MALLGSAGWWFPKWLERAAPKFSIEGEAWFAAHETGPSAEPETPQAEVVWSEAQEKPPQSAPQENSDPHPHTQRTHPPRLTRLVQTRGGSNTA